MVQTKPNEENAEVVVLVVPGSRLTLLMALVLAIPGKANFKRWELCSGVTGERYCFGDVALVLAKQSYDGFSTATMPSCRCSNNPCIPSHDPFCLRNSVATPASFTIIPRYQQKTNKEMKTSIPIDVDRQRSMGRSGTARLCFRLRLLLLVFLALLLSFLVLLLQLSLVRLLLLLGLGNGFEESLQTRLLVTLDVLLKLCRSSSNTVFRKPLLVDEELYQTVHVGFLPLEIAEGVFGGSDIGLEEEVAGILVGPVFGKGVLALFVALNELDDLLQAAMLANELQRGVRTDLWNGVEVVAAEQDAEVDELVVRC